MTKHYLYHYHLSGKLDQLGKSTILLLIYLCEFRAGIFSRAGAATLVDSLSLSSHIGNELSLGDKSNPARPTPS
jgi:hypothetical protein